jgi:hypothetical protein
MDTSTLHYEPSPHDQVGDVVRTNANLEAFLCEDGKWVIRKYTGAHNSGSGGPKLDFVDIKRHADFMDVMVEFAEIIGIDLKHPQAPSPICTCPKECDCQSPEHGSFSMHCPVHNKVPIPNPDCPQHALS